MRTEVCASAMKGGGVERCAARALARHAPPWHTLATRPLVEVVQDARDGDFVHHLQQVISTELAAKPLLRSRPPGALRMLEQLPPSHCQPTEDALRVSWQVEQV